MNLLTGIAMLGIALVLIWLGRPDRSGTHRRFLRFCQPGSFSAGYLGIHCAWRGRGDQLDLK